MYKKISKKALEDGLKALEKSYGGKFAEEGLKDADYKAIPTGHDDLDAILTRSNGGIFLGGVCEIFGGEGSGKTSLAMRTVGQAQELGLHCAWVDAEHSFSPDLALVNRCNPDILTQVDLTTGEGEDVKLLNVAEVLNKVFKAVWSDVFSLIVVDSVAAFMAERIADTDLDPNQKGMGEVARVMSEQMSRIVSACSKKECTVIFINQIREKIGVMFGSPETTPGGRALKFYSNQRISVSKIEGKRGLIYQIADDNAQDLVGHYARVKIVKNRKNMPCYDTLEIPIYYREYFPDTAKKCYDKARELQVITTRRGVLTWKNPKGEVICQMDGESDILGFIRGTNEDASREAFLAYCCVEAGNADKNKTKKIPVKVPQGIIKLSEGYDPNEKPKSKPKSKRGEVIIDDLDAK